MLVIDYRRYPDDSGNAEPPVIVVEPWSGFVFVMDDEDGDTPPRPPRNLGRGVPGATIIERWMGLAAVT